MRYADGVSWLLDLLLCSMSVEPTFSPAFTSLPCRSQVRPTSLSYRTYRGKPRQASEFRR